MSIPSLTGAELTIINSEFKNLTDVFLGVDAYKITIEECVFSEITQTQTNFFSLVSSNLDLEFTFKNSVVE